MAAHTSAAHRVVRTVLMRHLHTQGTSVAELATMFAVTPTYVRKILEGPPGRKRTRDEKAIEAVAVKHEAYLVRAGYGFFFR